MGKKEDKAKERRDRGQAYLDELLARVPEDRRDATKEVFAADEFLDFFGEGVLRQSDYSRVMDEAKKSRDLLEAEMEKSRKMYEDNIRWRASQEAGVEEMQSKLDRYETLFKADPVLGDGTGGDPSADPAHPNGVDTSKFISREDAEKALKERIEETERNGLQLMAMLTNIQARHLKDFNEALDATEIFEHANKVKLPLPQAYEDYVKPRVEERREIEHEEALARAREEGKMEAIRSANPVLPHHVGNEEPTVLAALESKDRSEFGLSKAVDDYYKMQADKQAT